MKIILLDDTTRTTYEALFVSCRGGKLEKKLRDFYPQMKIYMQKETFREVA